MKRAFFTVIGLGWLAFCFSTPARAQDQIKYLDRKTMKEATASGTIEDESPQGVVYKPAAGAGTREIAALDISEVTYEVPGAIKLTYRSALGDEKRAADPSARDAERKKSLADALKSYQEILPRLSEGKLKFAERHVQFKIARLLARLAEEDKDQTGAAVEALSRYLSKYADGWQVTQAARLLARLQLARGDAAGARKTYEDLAAIPKIPEAVRKECDFQIAEAMIRGKDYSGAQKKLESLLSGSAGDEAQATRARIYLAECLGANQKLQEAVTQLETIIAKTSDKDLKAAAYNALGDCYRLNSKPRDALWPYLWVDVIYHQDRQEHVKAMEQLAQLFEELGDKTRAQEYRSRLKKESR
jgi:hypothetical protein